MTNLERLQNIGIRRLGTPKRGFRYKPASGRLTNEDLKRIYDLKIPPAWTDVFINPAPMGKVQAIGKDAAGRWQYLYHESHTRAQELRKLAGIIQLRDDDTLFVLDEFVNCPIRQRIEQQKMEMRYRKIPLRGEVDGFLHGAFGRAPGNEGNVRFRIAVLPREDTLLLRLFGSGQQLGMALVAHFTMRCR